MQSFRLIVLAKLIPCLCLSFALANAAGALEPPVKTTPVNSAKKGPAKVRVFVGASENSVFRRIDDSTIQFVKGSVLVSVRPPMKSATVKTPFGTVTVPSDSVVYVSLANGQLQVQHLHGNADSNVSTVLKSGLFKSSSDAPLPIAVGQHMTGSLPVTGSGKSVGEPIPPLPIPAPIVTTINQASLQNTGRAINSMSKSLPNLASRKRFAVMTKTPLIDDYVDDFKFDDNQATNDSDTTDNITSPDDVPSTDIAPADSFQTARENVQQGEFQPEADTQSPQDDSGLEDMWGRASEGPDVDATGGMLEPGGIGGE